VLVGVDVGADPDARLLDALWLRKFASRHVRWLMWYLTSGMPMGHCGSSSSSSHSCVAGTSAFLNMCVFVSQYIFDDEQRHVPVVQGAVDDRAGRDG
jgi:hypothetical protein